MSIAVICPRCQTPFGITDDLADEPVCCPKCTNVFARGGSAGIQAGAPPQAPKTPPAEREDDEEPLPRSRPHASPRAPFPTVPLLILVCGLLFLLLAVSAGFNIWVIAHPELRFERDQQVIRAEQEARMANLLAEQNALLANQQKAQKDEAKVKRDLDNVRRELEEVRQQLEDAKRKLDKDR